MAPFVTPARAANKDKPMTLTLTSDIAEPAALPALLASTDHPVWLRVGQVIDGASERPIRDADIVFDAHQIRFVGRNGARPAPALVAGRTAPDAVLPDHTLMPCLIEAHAHLFLDGGPIDTELRQRYLELPPEAMLERARARWPKILQYGIGTVRDAGDKVGVGLALAAEAKSRCGIQADTPWIDSPGAAIHHRGRYGSFMGQPIEEYDSPAACVDGRIADGVDRIKLLVSGIINFKVGQVTAAPQMTIEEVAALVAAAHDRGRQTFAHASGTDGIENAIEGGVTTVEHGFFITLDQLTRMRDRQIGWVPTFAPVQVQIDHAAEMGWSPEIVSHLQRIIDAHQRMLSLGHELGVPIIAGSDAGSCGVAHGLGFLHELCHMERAGLPPMTVLRAATGVSADTLYFAEPIGRIAPGYRSRLILTRHDPLETVANLQREKTILFDGNVVQDRGHLDTEGL